MNIRINYETLKERKEIISEKIDLYLIECHETLNDGNFLIFSDEKPLDFDIIKTPEQQKIQDLENQLLLNENEKVGGIL